MVKAPSLILLFIISVYSFAQSPKDKGLSVINSQSAESYIGFLADDLLEGREAGTRGAYIAAEYIKSVLMDIGIKPFIDDSYFQPFDAVGVKVNKGVRYSLDTDSITEYRKRQNHKELSLKNILGYIEGRKKGEYVIVGAHYDHLGTDDLLAGDKIYNGADDNASGVSAVLQIAKAFVATGVQPERNIIFAFWDGEESGLLGSKYFVTHFDNKSAVKGYLNFDMIGRNNDESKPRHVVYFYTASHPVFGDWLKKDITQYNLQLEPDCKPWDRPVSGSDNASFARHDIPVIWYHTDGHADYHKPTDHTDKINWAKLADITKAAYLNLWNLANLDNY